MAPEQLPSSRSRGALIKHIAAGVAAGMLGIVALVRAADMPQSSELPEKKQPSHATADLHGPAPAEPDAPPAAEKNVGSLVIAGGGLLSREIHECFLELAGRDKARIAVIPTASIEADESGRSVGEFWSGHRFFAEAPEGSDRWARLVHTRDRARANDPAFTQPLEEATGVWISGGRQHRLEEAYSGTRVAEELRRLLARGGVIGGTSAGAAAMSEPMIVGGNPAARIGTGFGLVPNTVIDMHFDNRSRFARLQGVLDQNPDCIGLGIAESTALVISGTRARVIGVGVVSVCAPGRTEPMERIGDGAQVDLTQLRVTTKTAMK